MLTDFRSALRSLRATPGTAVLAWAVLAVAMAAGIVTFSVVDTVVLRRLPFDRDDRLVAIPRVSHERGHAPVISPQDYLACRDLTDIFEGVAGVSVGLERLQTGPATEPIPAADVVGDLFSTLHAHPFMGAAPGTDYASGQDRVVVLSFRAWQRRFGAAPDIIGKTITFSDGSREVIAVMPPEFEYPVGLAEAVEIWIPYVMRPSERQFADGGRGYFFNAIARLRNGVTLAQAASRLGRTMDALTAQYPSFGKTSHLDVVSLRESMSGPARGWMLIALVAVGLVLVTACLNVAGLLLARATVRSREFAVRAALGESTARRVRTLFIESLMLALVAASSGLLLAGWVLVTVKGALPAWVARVSSIAVDTRVSVCAVVGAVVMASLFGALPAWRASRVDLARGLQGGAGSRVTTGRRRLREALLVTEVAFVTAALVCATFFITSFVRLVRADIGFDRTNIVFSIVRVAEPRTESDQTAAETKGLAVLANLTSRLREVPGVARVGISNGGMPLIPTMARYSIKVPGRAEEFDGADMALYRSVSSDYFAATGMRLARGRLFDIRDDAPGSEKVAILNVTAARRYFPNDDALGSRVEMFQRPRTVVGIVDDMRLMGPEDDVRPELYLPLREDPTGLPYLTIKTTGPPQPLIPAIQSAIRTVVPGSAPPRVFVLEDQFRSLTVQRRVAAGFMSAFGLLALVIGAGGIYAVMAFVVVQRTRDIGVRMALGASRRRVVGEVMREAARHVVLGSAIGLLAAWIASGLIASFLFGVTTNDWSVYAAVALILTVVGLAAALLPARRASRVDPLIALRAE